MGRLLFALLLLTITMPASPMRVMAPGEVRRPLWNEAAEWGGLTQGPGVPFFVLLQGRGSPAHLRRPANDFADYNHRIRPTFLL